MDDCDGDMTPDAAHRDARRPPVIGVRRRQAVGRLDSGGWWGANKEAVGEGADAGGSVGDAHVPSVGASNCFTSAGVMPLIGTGPTPEPPLSVRSA